MSYTGKNSGTNTVQIWDGTRWVQGTYGAGVAVGTVNGVGSSSSLSKADHTHEVTGGVFSGTPLTYGAITAGQAIVRSGSTLVGQTLSYQTVRDNGADLTQRPNLNFLAGTNVTLSIVDDGGSAQTTVTINASGGATPAGLNQQVQYNNAGSFGASANLTFDAAAPALTIGTPLSGDAQLYIGNSFQVHSGITNAALSGTGTGSLLFQSDASLGSLTGTLEIRANSSVYTWPTVAPAANALLTAGSGTPETLQFYTLPTPSAPAPSANPIVSRASSGALVADAPIWADYSTLTKQLIFRAGSSTSTSRILFMNDTNATQIGMVGSTSTTKMEIKKLGSASLAFNDVNWPDTLAGDGYFLTSLLATASQWTQTPNFKAQTTPPGAPVDGVNAFAKSLGGRAFLAQVEPTNLASLVQEFLGQGSVGIWKPPGNATTVPGVFGQAAFTAVGTATARNVATTNSFTRRKRLGYVSAAAINSAASVRLATAQITVGNGAGLGGFFKVIRFGVSDAVLVGDATMFVGVGSAAAIAGGVSPATLTNSFGVGRRSTDTNMQLFYGGTVAQTPVDLGASYPSNTTNTNAYELVIFSPPSSNSVIYYQLTNLTTGATTGTQSVTGTPSTQIPSSGTLISQTQIYRSTVAGAAAVGIDILSDYTWGNN